MSKKDTGSLAPQAGGGDGSINDLAMHFLQTEEPAVDQDQNNVDEDNSDSETDLSQTNTDTETADEAGDGQEIQEQDTAADDDDDQGDEGDQGSEAEEGEGDEADGEPDASKIEYPAFKKRVDKLTRQKGDLKGEIDELKAKLLKLEAGQQAPAAKTAPAPKSKDPFDNLRTQEDVNAKATEANEVYEWGLQLLEGTDDSFVVKTGEDSEEELSREDVRNIIQRAQHTLTSVLPGKSQQIQQRSAYDQLAQEEYTWLKDQQSKEFQEVAQMRQAFPELERFPDINLSLADLVEGRKARVARKKTAGKKQALKSPKIAPSQPGRSSSPAPIEKGKVATRDAMDAVNASGGQQGDLETLFKTL
jgi:hypothetical protein